MAASENCCVTLKCSEEEDDKFTIMPLMSKKQNKNKKMH